MYKIVPSKFVTANEIAAAEQVHMSIFNAQAPSKITYPMTFITAKAYVDQLARGNALSQDKATALNAAMDKKNTKALKTYAATFRKDAASASPADAARMNALAEILSK